MTESTSKAHIRRLSTLNPPFLAERPCDDRPFPFYEPDGPSGFAVRVMTVLSRGRRTRSAVPGPRAPTWHIRADRAIRSSCGLLRPLEAPDSLPSRATTRIERTILGPGRAIEREVATDAER